jgi:RNA polymerase sigma factor (TIGR02999 family)
MKQQNITLLLRQWRDGSDQALDELTPLVYHQLRLLARRIFSGESAGHTLQPTILVNEVFERLIGKEIDWQDRNHFFSLSSRLMRRILVDHANAKLAQKRGGEDAIRISYCEDSLRTQSADMADVLALDTALLELASFDSRKAHALELHFFAGFTYKDVADALGVAESTVHQDMRTAKAWLNTRLSR